MFDVILISEFTDSEIRITSTCKYFFRLTGFYFEKYLLLCLYTVVITIDTQCNGAFTLALKPQADIPNVQNREYHELHKMVTSQRKKKIKTVSGGL